MCNTLTASAVLLGLTPLTALAAPYPDGDAAKGAKIYKKCVACHMIGAKAKNRIGPHLNKIIGREITGLSDYKYSKAMTAYATKAKNWDVATLDAYLANPRKAVNGTTMAFVGLRKQADRQNVIAYLRARPK